MEQRPTLTQRHDRILGLLHSAKDSVSIHEYKQELDDIEEAIAAASLPLAFDRFSPADQERFVLAADYADLTIELTDHTGKIIAYLAA